MSENLGGNMFRTNGNELERLPLHQAIIVGIENCLMALSNLNNRKPKVNPSTDVGSLHKDHKTLLLHEKEVAEARGQLKAYLSLLTCNMKKEHLDEITKKLWEFTQRFDNSDIVSALRKQSTLKTMAKKTEQ